MSNRGVSKLYGVDQDKNDFKNYLNGIGLINSGVNEMKKKRLKTITKEIG